MARITKKKFKEACKGSGGVQAVVAKAIGVTRQAVGLYLKKHPDMRDFLESEGEQIMDVAEHNIDKKIVEGDIDSSQWALVNRKKGKARGYGSRHEFDVSDQTTRIIIERADNANDKMETKSKTGTGTGSPQ